MVCIHTASNVGGGGTQVETSMCTQSPRGVSRRYLAALLPGLMSLRFLLAGLGITREPRLVAGTAVSSSCRTHATAAGAASTCICMANRPYGA